MANTQCAYKNFIFCVQSQCPFEQQEPAVEWNNRPSTYGRPTCSPVPPPPATSIYGLPSN